MSKRTLAEQPSAPEPERRRVDGAQPMKEEEGMGEFEDPFEDEIESDGEIVHHEDDDMDEEDDEPEPARVDHPGLAQSCDAALELVLDRLLAARFLALFLLEALGLLA